MCGFSFCCFTFNPINFSLEQNILVVSRQAFILCWELHQVWEQPSINAVILVVSRQAFILCWELHQVWEQCSITAVSIATHITAVMLGCSQNWWSSQQRMKACLETTSMFCSREKLIGLKIWWVLYESRYWRWAHQVFQPMLVFV